MTEFEKLTVAKLREELTKRGLPKTGLKAALIQRLNEADEPSTQEVPSTKDSRPESPESKDVEESAPPTAVAEGPQPVLDATSAKEDGGMPTPPPVNDPAETDPITNDESSAEPTAIGAQLDGSEEDGFNEPAQADIASVPAQANDLGEDAPSKEAVQAEPPLDSSTTSIIDPVKPAENGVELTIPRQDSLSGEEVLEDMKKRKRRSTTPPPSSASVPKKAKLEDARPHVKLPEDTSMEEVDASPKPHAPVEEPTQAQVPAQTQDGVVTDAPTVQEVDVNGRTRPAETPAEDVPPVEVASRTLKKASEEPDEEPAQQAPGPTGSSTAPLESPAKRSPSDARFKNILLPATRRDMSPAPTTDTPDRTVTPAVHPATTALYIRNILRPLHVENLRDHLLSLATPSSASPDPTIIVTFHLDAIRTHCLVRFSSVAAASRVRTGLHERIWPDEKNRKPLWVDFVPEEKLDKWIEVENEGEKGGRGAGGRKRWEVVYEDEEAGVKAYLQEVGSNIGGPRGSAQAPLPRPTTEIGAGVKGAPSGPRLRDSHQDRPQQPPPPSMDKARGFQALDDLFRSTTAKPKLYYLPVPGRIADKRLDMLAEGRGGGRGGDEMRRYTFEEGLLVDRGPEFGMRGRGGGGYRGRGGRGGGYRWDDRGEYRGDHRRDRR
ncbi:MAG: hypothetical protein Q9184_002795 [Pyrenodesmia sp. 2 TL-2023]